MLDRFTWRQTAEGTAEHYYLELEAHARRALRRRARRAAVAHGRLRSARAVAAASDCSTSASGGGRHTFEAMRRGARVTALDYSAADLKDVAAVAGAMLSRARSRAKSVGGRVNGDALAVCRSPTTRSTASIVSEVLEHIWDDERAIVEDRARAASRRSGRGHGPDPLARARLVGAQRRSTTTRRADTSASTVSTSSSRSSNAPGCFLRGSHHAHAFHSPYWWLKCAYGIDNTEAAPVKRYHDFLCHLIEHNPRWARVTRASAQSGPRQEPRRVRREGARRPMREVGKAQP